jgi:8-oxo-dGTP pyrophosphatase MutT (NUDIX family)
MVRRHDRARFMAGAHVFPGGGVDPTDFAEPGAAWLNRADAASAHFPELPARDAVAFHIAAIRELFEEAGVLLTHDDGPVGATSGPGGLMLDRLRADVNARHASFPALVANAALRLDVEALTPFAHWVTPPPGDRRFDTRFFLARLPLGQNAAPDDAETTEGAWLTPRAALDAAVGRRLILPPPTWATLRELEPLVSVDEALQWASSRQIDRREPLLVVENSNRVMIMPGHPRHPTLNRGSVPFETEFVWTESDRVWLPAQDRRR